MNPVMWNLLSTEARTTDLKAQKLETVNSRAMTALARGIEDVKKLAEATKMPKLVGIFETLLDSLTMMSYVRISQNVTRKESMKTSINPAYRHLCTSTVPVSDQLFGDNIEEQIKMISDANKLRDQLRVRDGKKPGGKVRGAYNNNIRGGPYARPRGFQRGRGLPRGRGQFNGRGRY